jgi:hypothetical protein
MMANATLNTLKANNEDMDLKISAFSLGKIWFKILNADKDTEVQVGLHNAAQKKSIVSTESKVLTRIYVPLLAQGTWK